MKKLIVLTIAGFVLSVLTGKATGQPVDSITCHISGTVINRPDSKEVMIIEAGKDFRVNDYITVPVTDGKFSFTLHSDIPRAYEVVFNDELERGSYTIRYFYSGNGEVELIYYNSDQSSQNKIISDIPDNILANNLSDLTNARFHAKQTMLEAKLDSLQEHKAAYTPELQRLLTRQKEMEPSQESDSIFELIMEHFRRPREQCFSKEFISYDNKLIEVYRDTDSLKRAFIKEKPSMFGLFAIKNALERSKYCKWIDVYDYIDIFETYKDLMPYHPYTQEIALMTDAMNVKSGNRYPDYTVTREDGSTERISSLIKDNVAVIDLWASWCGPCRKHSKELIPIYEKYKDKGFKVIAIARERDDCKAMNRAMEKDGYPWESFVDLNDRDKIWKINGANNSGGRIILVGADGIIVGTDISAGDIEEYLEATGK